MSHDTLLHRLVRPAMRPLARTSITPNQLTTVRLLTGVAAAVAFAFGGGWRSLGGAIFLASLLLDRADGELARLSGKISSEGYRYDLTCDCIATVAAFIGLGIGLRGELGSVAVALGVTAGASVVAVFYQINVLKVATTSGPALDGRTLVDADDAMVGLPVLVWLGLSKLALVLAGTATPVVVLVLVLRERLRAHRAHSASG